VAQRLGDRRRHHGAYVADHRLVLHLLRHVHPARDHPLGDPPIVVSLPVVGVEPTLRTAVGHCLSSRTPQRGRRVDVSQPRVWRQSCVQLLRRPRCGLVLGLETVEGTHEARGV